MLLVSAFSSPCCFCLFSGRVSPICSAPPMTTQVLLSNDNAEKNKSYEKTNSEFVEFVPIPRKLHSFKIPHSLTHRTHGDSTQSPYPFHTHTHGNPHTHGSPVKRTCSYVFLVVRVCALFTDVLLTLFTLSVPVPIIKLIIAKS